MNEFKTKEDWAKTLKPGDVVNDCRFKNLQIKECHKRYILPFYLRRIRSWMAPEWLPDKIFDVVFDVVEDLFGWIEDRLPKFMMKYADSDLVLEDGSHCSAMHCCDPAPQGENE